MSEHVARGEEEALLDRMRDGLGMLAFILLPTAAAMVAVAEPMSQISLQYGSMTVSGATLVGRVLAAFAVGLPTYSAFLVFTRAYYALGDTRTPAIVNAITVALAASGGALLFTVLPDEWKVPGLALGHSIGFLAGSVILTRLFTKHVGAVGSTKLSATVMRALVLSLAALAVMLVVRAVGPSASRSGYVASFVITAGAGLLVYVGGMYLLRAPELQRIAGLLRGERRRKPQLR